MATFMTSGIQNSATITKKAAAAIDDVRGRAFSFDSNGNAVISTDATKPIVGIGILSAGASNTLDGKDGAVGANDDIDIQVKEMGYGMAGAAITAGAELTTDAHGKLIPATGSCYVIATALESAASGAFVFVQITKYHLTAAAANG
jgi:hypothetical protein